MTPEETKRLNEIVRVFIYHQKDPEINFYREIFSFHENGRMKTDEEVEKEGYVLYDIFQPQNPEKPYAEQVYTREVLHKHFKEVLNLGFHNNPHSIRLYHTKFLSNKQIFLEINSLIDDHGFGKHRALFFYLIADIQDYFVKHIHRSNTDERKTQIRNIEKEGKKLEQVIDWYTDKSWEKGSAKPKPKPSSVTFTYPSTKENPSLKITINDSFLIHHILEGTKKDLENEPYFGWKLGLKRSVSVIKEDEEKLYFKERLVSALHHFLTEEGLFQPDEANRSSNQEMRFISRILELTLVADWDEEKDKEDLIKQLRNYILPKRDKLQRVPDFLKVEPTEYNTLLKFFPEWFLNASPAEKDMHNLKNATILMERFELHSKGAEIVHILACYGIVINRIESDFRWAQHAIEYVPKIKAFFEFLNFNGEKLKEGKITGITFQKEGHENPFEISDPTPLALIQKALKEYIRAFPEDVTNDVILIAHKNDPEHGYMYGPADEFRAPEQRFYPWFCKHFYLYLEAQFPKDGYPPRLAEERKEIIALTILLYQYHHIESERFIEMYFKVENWLRLSGLDVPSSGIRV